MGDSPDDYVKEVLNRCKQKYVARHFKIYSWTDHIDFLEQMAKKSGRLGKGGEPDINAVSKMVLTDWNRGKLPFFTPPPGCMMEPRPEGAVEDTEEEEEDDVEDEEEEQEEVADDELDLPDDDAESDTDTVQTTDTNQTSETVDSLFEDVKFRREDEEERDAESVESQTSKPKIDLREFVKQDFKGIVTSLDYFDEEKYEGGKRIKKTKKAKKVAEQQPTSSQSTQENAEENKEDKAEESEDNKTLSEHSETSSKRKKSSETKSPKKVKTASGTFKVSKSRD